MEQPPGSFDDLQPQDLSTSSVPTVIDLTRKGKSPGWFQNSGTVDPGLAFSETGSADAALGSGERVQADDAFSHTTVTLSYVSRSRVFSTPDSLTPPLGRFALRPCDSDKGLAESGYLLDQRYLEQVDGPVDLAAQDGVGAFLTRDHSELNGGGAVGSDGDVDNQTPGEDEDVESSGSWEMSRVLENGQADDSPETLEEQDGSEVVFLASKRQGSRPGNGEYVSPLEDPVSPSATSLDDVEDEFLLPQASSSPSGDNSYLDGSSTDDTIQLSFDSGANGARLDSSGESERRAPKPKAPVEFIDLTGDDVSEETPAAVVPHVNGNAKAPQRRSSERKLPARPGRGVRLEAIVMDINSSRCKVSGRVRAKKNAGASDSDAARPKSRKKKNDSDREVGKRKSGAKTTKRKPGDENLNANTDSTSDTEVLSRPRKSHGSVAPQKSPKSPPSSADKQRSRKEPEGVSPAKTPARSKAKRSSRPSPRSAVNETNREPEPSRLSPPPPPPSSSKSPKKSRCKAQSPAAESRSPPTAKTKARAPKRRRKKPSARRSQPPPSSSMFSPKEPEIKLRYVNYKEDKREPRSDGFAPYVRVERRQPTPSLCTVVNYPEDVRTPQPKKSRQQALAAADFISAAVPSTSCVQLGRASARGQHRRAFVCCLCGQPANAMDLGDLHGPYYPEGHQRNAKTPADAAGVKEEEEEEEGGGSYSDTDSSSLSVRRRTTRKRAVPPALRSRAGAQLKQSQRWSGGGGGTDGPAAKRPRSDGGGDGVEDWYSAPVLPLEPCEYWLHEDCAIWSAGVFLVRGKVYGLEEALKAARDTVCSACRDPGASLGCFFKGCPSKYHYRCALRSAGCALIEENFSMKCQKHKNKTLKAASGKRWDDR